MRIFLRRPAASETSSRKSRFRAKAFAVSFASSLPNEMSSRSDRARGERADER